MCWKIRFYMALKKFLLITNDRLCAWVVLPQGGFFLVRLEWKISGAQPKENVYAL